MKSFLLIFFYLISVSLFCQKIDESNITITMSLEQVNVIRLIKDDYVEISNTDYIIFNYNNRYIELFPGIHRLKIKVNDPVKVILIPSLSENLKSETIDKKIIKDGQEDIDQRGDIILKDYVEYTIDRF